MAKCVCLQIKYGGCEMKDEEASSPDSGRKPSQQQQQRQSQQQQQQQVSWNRIFILRTDLK